jgi:hypothetical protein
MVEFIFKRANFNSNGPITSRHVTTTYRPQRQAVVRAVPPDATVQPGFNADDAIRPGQAPAPPPGPVATSSRAGDSARPPGGSA